MAFLFILMFTNLISLTITAPVLPSLLESIRYGGKSTAVILGLFVSVGSFLQFAFAPLLGSLSDWLGRRPVLLFSLLGLGVDQIIMSLAPDVGWLFAARVISGITSATGVAAFAYAADITPGERRVAVFGMLGAGVSLGLVLGPGVGGYLGEIGLRLPFMAAAALCFFNIILGFFALPETLTAETRSPFSWKKANPLGSLILLRSNIGLLRLGAMTFLAQFAQGIMPVLFVLYCTHRYGWKIEWAGLAMAVQGVLAAGVQGGLAGRITERFGAQWAVVAGLAFGAAGFAIYGSAATGLVFALGVPLVSVYSLADPASRAMMSQLVSRTQQGQLQGVLSSVSGIARTIAPFVFGSLYALFGGRSAHGEMTGIPFILAAAIFASAIPLALTSRRPATA